MLKLGVKESRYAETDVNHNPNPSVGEAGDPA